MEKKKILIIDDEVDLIGLLKTRLEMHNYYIMPCYTSSRGLEIAKREKPDLVLLDVMMPDLNGYEVCKILKHDDETKEIPIILFTAKLGEKEQLKKESEDAGANDYIPKPFEPADLLVKIISLIGK